MSEAAPERSSTWWAEFQSSVGGRVTRQWAVLTTANVARLPVALLTSVVVARSLGVGPYGDYQVLVTVATVAGVLADPGLGEAAIWRFARLERSGSAGASGEVGAYFWNRVLAGGLVTTALLLFSDPIAHAVGLSGGAAWVALVPVVVVVMSVGDALRSLLQASRRIQRLAITLVVTTVATLAAAVGLWTLGGMSVPLVLTGLPVTGGVAGFFVARHGLPPDWSFGIPGRSAIVRSFWRLFRFGRWLWLGNVATVFATRLDILLVSRALTESWTGAYGLALALMARVGSLYRTFFTVLRPVASAVRGRAEAQRYLRRALMRSGVLAVSLSPGLALADPLIPWLFGAEYGRSVLIFQGLLIVGMLEAIFIPMKTLFYTIDRPGQLSGIEALEAIILVGGSYLTLPAFGVWGVIASKAAARLAGAALAGAALVYSWEADLS